MIPALICALSVPGAALLGWLLKPVHRARDVAVVPDDPDVVSFGFDSRGMV